jgi:hypothetical protein
VDHAGGYRSLGGDAAIDTGGQAVYSDSAIQTCLMLRAAFKLALRQAEGLMLSVVELLGCELAVPDHTTLSRRWPGWSRSPAGRCLEARCTS